MAHGDAPVVQRVEIDRKAERRANLVVSPVALSNISGLIVIDEHAGCSTQRLEQAPARLSQLWLLQEGKHSGLVGRDSRVKPEHDPSLSFAIDVVNVFLVVGVDQKCEAGAIDAERRFNHVWEVLTVLRLVEILEVLAAE